MRSPVSYTHLKSSCVAGLGICHRLDGRRNRPVFVLSLIHILPFIVLLLGLFVVAGGIALKGTLVGTTKVNAVLLLIGTVLASWIGTTGAAMLLIRPIIKANAWREKKVHIIVFFII